MNWLYHVYIDCSSSLNKHVLLAEVKVGAN